MLYTLNWGSNPTCNICHLYLYDLYIHYASYVIHNSNRTSSQQSYYPEKKEKKKTHNINVKWQLFNFINHHLVDAITW